VFFGRFHALSEDRRPERHPRNNNHTGARMKRSLMLSCLAAATALTMGLATPQANAAPLTGAAIATTLDTAATDAVPVNYRRGHRGYGGSSFGFYLGAPSYGPRCWWSHRHHRRVCSYY
jgi:hypothetical protein